MKVLLIYQNHSLPSSRIRIIQVAPYLEKLGILCTLRPYDVKNIKDHKQFDAIILQKKLLSWWDYLYWKRVKTPVIFDFDDAIFIRQTAKNGSYQSKTRLRRFGNNLKLAKSVVAGNSYLAEYCCKLQKSIYIIPSAVPHNVPLHQHPKVFPKQYSYRIGWVGTANNLYMLDKIIPDLTELYKDISFELHILSNKKLKAKTDFPIINHAWSEKKQGKVIATFDIGIMPMEDTPWTRGKCSYKLLQYMSAQVVAVGDPIGMNSVVINHSKNGILIINNDWHKSLLPILQDKKAMQDIAQKGRITVKNKYTYEHIAKQWQQALIETTKQ